MSETNVRVTEAGLRRLEAELSSLCSYRRREIAEEIRQAKECGDLDLAEESDSSQGDQFYVEQRIAQIRPVLQLAVPVCEADIPTAYVGLGSLVTLEEVETEEPWEVRIVGAAEADPIRDWISDECPVGAALMGKRVEDTVEVLAPAGRIEYRIVSISRALA